MDGEGAIAAAAVVAYWPKMLRSLKTEQRITNESVIMIKTLSFMRRKVNQTPDTRLKALLLLLVLYRRKKQAQQAGKAGDDNVWEVPEIELKIRFVNKRKRNRTKPNKSKLTLMTNWLGNHQDAKPPHKSANTRGTSSETWNQEGVQQQEAVIRLGLQ